MKKLELKQMEETNGGREFWGNGTVNHSHMGCSWSCQQNYVFWIAVGSEYACTEPVCVSPF